MASNTIELSCGNCGCADMRLRGVRSTGVDRAYAMIEAVCVGCEDVTRFRPGQPVIRLSCPADNTGLLAPIPWAKAIPLGRTRTGPPDPDAIGEEE